jgi:hypothetical protein
LSSSGSEKSLSEKSLSSYEIQSKSKKSSFGLNFKPKKLLKSVTKGLGSKSVSLSDISYLNKNKKSDSLPNIENISNETTGKSLARNLLS